LSYVERVRRSATTQVSLFQQRDCIRSFPLTHCLTRQYDPRLRCGDRCSKPHFLTEKETEATEAVFAVTNCKRSITSF
jgi:hypothetical protein